MPALQHNCWLTAALRPTRRPAATIARVVELLGRRLLAQQVPAGRQCALGERALLPGRHRDVDDLDRRVGQHGIEYRVDAADPVSGGLSGRLGVDVVAGHDVQPVAGVGRQVGVVHDPAAADHADAVAVPGRERRLIAQLKRRDGHG
jgi:hypothetical protein